MSFCVGRGSFGPYETVEVRHDSGLCSSVALRGATLLSWQVPGPRGPVDLVDGYASPAELGSQDGVRNGVLAPFPNRVADARYDFAGVRHDLAPGTRDRLLYHGFLRLLDLSLDRVDVEAAAVRLRFLSRELRPGRFAGYPFAVDVSVEYLLTPVSIELAVTGRNVGRSAAPYASGWHPYFRLPVGIVDDWELTIPAAQAIEVDDDLIPLPGETAFLDLDGVPALDYRKGRRVGADVVDRSWTGLRNDEDGRSRTTVADPAGNRLTVWQDSGLMHVFTGDTLARDRRRSLALEPVEVMTDAFNRCDVALAPGAARAFRFGVEAQIVGA
jgi:aldose 1-epimerase